MVGSVMEMKNRKTKNPLIKRIPRELLGDWKKYLVVSLFLILTIGFVSGMYVANGSMMKAADNVGLEVGDRITVSGQPYEVVGLIAYVNYSTLHEKSTDMMFDALKFDVAMVTDSGFARLDKGIHYTYAWKYVNQPGDESEEGRGINLIESRKELI